MGFRFRKTVRLGRLVRLNFSGSGVSLGLGPRGANVNLSRRGVRQTVGLPGTGLSYQTFTKWRSPPPSLPPAVPEASPPAATGRDRQYSGFLRFVGAFALVTILAAILGLANNKPKAPISSTASTVPATPPAMAVGPEAREQAAPPVVNSATPLAPAPSIAPLTGDEIRELQTWLKAFGLDAGPIDGLLGPLTTSAIKKYEAARGLPVAGNADRPLLEHLRKDKGGAIH